MDTQDSDTISIAEQIKDENPQNDSKPQKIEFSNYATALLDNLQRIKHRLLPDDLSKLSVSQTVSFLAIAYEKVRNAIEYRDDHLVLRAAIERNLKRRLALNPEGRGEAENLLRELMWARYFPNESLGDQDIQNVQAIIDKYLSIRTSLLVGKERKTQLYLFTFLFELLTCEIEEKLNPASSQSASSFTYFIFQTLKEKIKVEGLEEDKKDTFLLIALDKTYRKSDLPYLRHYLFTTFYQPLSQLSHKELQEFIPSLPAIFKKIDSIIANPHVDSLVKFVKKQLPPFLILFDIIKQNSQTAKSILSNKESLWRVVEKTCNARYKEVGSRLKNLAVRSLIYIFITKMLLALILEYPLSIFFYGNVHKLSIAINTLFPPLLMLIIILFFKLPGDDNTKNIYHRIIDIIDKDKSFEKGIAYMKKKITRKPALVFIFTIFYSLTFFVTLYLLNSALARLDFNLISKGIFIFFISVVSFFSYRIKSVSNEYKLKEKEGIFTPIVDFFFMPILSLGKLFSRGISHLNVFIIVFDFIIEAPFKLVIEIFEEWIKFIRARKEEMV